jgi:hypothetical protein
MNDMFNYIKKYLTKIQKDVQNIKFRCEFNQASSTFIVEVQPVEIFKEDDMYNEFEYEFTRKFELKYPGYMIMFISDDSLIKVENPIFEIDYSFRSEQIPTAYIPNDNWVQSSEDNIALAA